MTPESRTVHTVRQRLGKQVPEEMKAHATKGRPLIGNGLVNVPTIGYCWNSAALPPGIEPRYPIDRRLDGYTY
jgi:hypothetical protein